jgi:hypothetical protein
MPQDDLPPRVTLAAQFYATLMGGRLVMGPPDPDSMLAWWLALEPEQRTRRALEAEWDRRGMTPDPEGGFGYDSQH